ncbi:hypothetical protein MRX96_019441 [Rhipicephalus microplus]
MAEEHGGECTSWRRPRVPSVIGGTGKEREVTKLSLLMAHEHGTATIPFFHASPELLADARGKKGIRSGSPDTALSLARPRVVNRTSGVVLGVTRPWGSYRVTAASPSHSIAPRGPS